MVSRSLAVLLLATACRGSGVAGSDATSSPADGEPVSEPRPAGALAHSTGTADHQRYFPADAPWYRDYTDAPTHPESAEIIAWLERAGWGGGDRMRIDFSIEVLAADASTPQRTFQATDDFFRPDCDFVPVPVPQGGALEGEAGYACASDGDCHLIVADRSARKLYEMWRADIRHDTFRGGCLVVWDMDRVYPEQGRGDGCTSADAAGLPIAPLLVTADEVATGHVAHAIRFILPNEHIASLQFSRPATHSTRATRGPASAPPYGAHLRLRADYPLAKLPNEAARTIARALQKHGMFLADGGQITLTAQSDRSTAAKWEGLLAPDDLVGIRPADFAVIDWGPTIAYESVECSRAPLGGAPP